jgi:uncharacterized protein (DUF934 family)
LHKLPETCLQMSAPQTPPMKILAPHEHVSPSEGDKSIIAVANEVDVLALHLCGVQRIDLHFPSFTDGRAFSQAYLLRRRLHFSGDIRATGHVLLDQLVSMARTGFSSAVLQESANTSDIQRQFERFSAWYQADAVQAQPHCLLQEKEPGIP